MPALGRTARGRARQHLGDERFRLAQIWFIVARCGNDKRIHLRGGIVGYHRNDGGSVVYQLELTADNAAVVTDIVAEPSKPIPGGEYDIVDGVVIGVHEKTSVADFLKKSAGARVCDKNGRELTRGYVGTGCTVYYANGSACTVLVKGDTDGSGTADATDYLIAKRTYLGTYVISGLYYRAACIMGGDTLSMVDLLMLKRHVLGNADIYTVAK